MAQKTTAVLTTDNNAVVTSQTAPESITPVTLGALLQDLIDSMYNRADDAPLVIPSCFTGIVAAGDSANKLFQALLDKTCTLQTQIQGGVQGLPGEFLANITSDTNQTLTLTGLAGVYSSIAEVKFPNDKDNGSFDNGNNFLVYKFEVPTGGQPSVKFTASGLIVNLLANNLAGGGTITLKFVISNNGTQIGATESNEGIIADTDPTGNYYFIDFDTGLISVAAADVITVELYAKQSGGGSMLIALSNGFFNNELP